MSKAEFVKTLQKECASTLESTNNAGIPGGFNSYKEFDEFVKARATALSTCKGQLLRLYTQECNRGLYDFEKHNVELYEGLVRETCRLLGLRYTIDTDPRSAIILLHLPSGKTNDFGGLGYCVP